MACPLKCKQTSLRWPEAACRAYSRGTAHIKPSKSAHRSRSFLKVLHMGCPLQIARQLSNHLFASSVRMGKRNHELGLLHHELGIEHPLSKPGTSKINGVAERFNGCIKAEPAHAGANPRPSLDKNTVAICAAAQQILALARCT